jgi:hypothetical protein
MDIPQFEGHLTERRKPVMGKLTARAVESLASRKDRFNNGDGLYLRVQTRKAPPPTLTMPSCDARRSSRSTAR